MKGYGGASRRDLFERFDQPALRPLPAERFVYTEWREARVNIDYHVDVEHHSTPSRIGSFTRPSTCGSRPRPSKSSSAARGSGSIAASHHAGGYTTIPEHMPHAHRAHLEWSPSRLIRWGATVGPQTAALVEQILASRPHPEQGYRSCLGLLRLDEAVRPGPRRGGERARRRRRRPLLSPRRVDAQTRPRSAAARRRTDRPRPAPGHANVRGPAYYQQELPHAD